MTKIRHNSISFVYILLNCLALASHTVTQTTAAESKWTATFNPTSVTIHMHETAKINLTIAGLDVNQLKKENATITVVSDHSIAQVDYPIPLDDVVNATWHGQFPINAIFLGNAKVSVVITRSANNVESSSETLTVIIIREERMIDRLFTVSVAGLVSILYINFGAAMDLTKVKGILRRPIGPLIALFCHFLFLPVVSYLFGLWLFPDSVEMQLGIFFTGVSPAGGASNVWCAFLGANLDLSVAMTTISTFSALAIMPLWIFTLGRKIFDRGELVVPYQRIATFAFGLLIPLCIGLLIQKYLPRLARILVRVLKTFSALLIIFIIVFAIITNLYLFQLFTYEIIIAGLGLPCLGYLFGWFVSKLLRQNSKDCLTIAVESGIQNTGIAIFILRFALGQPQADLTTVMPVSVALMTPLPLIGLYLFLRCQNKLISPTESETLVTPKTENAPAIASTNRADER